MDLPPWVPWVFSGIGVFGLAAVVTFFGYVRKKRRGSTAPESLPAVQLSVVLASPSPEGETVPRSDQGALVLESVVTRIKDLPLLQKPELINHFRGLPLRHAGPLISASRTSGGKITLLVGGVEHLVGTAVAFDIDPASYPGLSLLKSGHEMTVSGVIDSMLGENIVVLREAKVRFELPT